MRARRFCAHAGPSRTTKYLQVHHRPANTTAKQHIPRPGYDKVESRTLVEVRFTALGNGRTRVELTQSNWEALGESAAMIRGGYGKGWTAIFEQAFKSACGG